MTKYAKEGLKAGAKIVNKSIRKELKASHYRTGSLYKQYTSWAKIDYDTGQPYASLGYRSIEEMQKRGVKYYVNPYWIEFGIKPHQIATKQFVKTGKSTYFLHDEMGNKFGIIVNHPGVKGKNLLRNTVYNNIKEIKEAQAESLKKITDLQVTKGLKVDLGGDEEID